MNTMDIKNKFDVLLKQLSIERSFDVAEKITSELVGLLNIKTTDRFLVNIPRVDAELTRFQLAPGFARQAAAYELPHEYDKPVDLKLFWIKKASKTNLSWLIGLTPNFEDALSNDYKNIGIDFVVPEACDSIIVLLSNRFKVRALELKDHITPTQLEIFAQWAKLSEVEIADQNELKNNLHAKLWESFNFEPINRKFYLELVEHFSILVHHLEKDLGRKPSVMFTTRLIGRLLFIWFLKKKNLVNTGVEYFSVPDPERQAEYYQNQLEKLFFEVLNIDELERNNGDKLTPYLNGGLFDKSTTDFYGNPKLTFPNGYFNQLFNTLNKYNFTVDESSPEFQHVAVDPEMLGRIFESLLAEQIDENTGNSKKKATAAFYTPREIVSYMCEQSLIEYLKTKVPDSPDRDRRIDELVRMPEALFRDQDQNKRRDWKPYRESIINALEGTKTESPLTVLDPAVGSGAFPMGMLHLLVKVYSRLDPKFEKDISGLKRDILSRSLYGVDIEQTAIEITRLRAWLSIIVDIPEGEKVEPLPNLEFKFVCANTLIPLDNTEQATFFTDHDLKDKLINIRDDYFRTSSKAKKEKLQKDYLKLTQSASLFDNKKTQQLKSYRPFDISSSSEFYDPELMHGVQAFDVVIGNPPYITFKGKQKVKVPEVILNQYLELYKNSAEYKINSYALFIERGFGLIKDRSILSYIIPSTILQNEYLGKIRKFILNNFHIDLIITFGNKVFEAVTDSIILQCSKIQNSNKTKTLRKNDLNLSETPVFIYYNQNDWLHQDNGIINLKATKIQKEIIIHMEKGSYELDKFFNANIGIKRASAPIEKYIKSTEYKKFIVGGDLSRFCLNSKGNYILFKKEFFHTGVDEHIFLQKEKVLVRKTGNILIASYDENQFYTDQSIYNIYYKSDTNELSLKYICAILNSRLMNWYFNKKMITNADVFPYIKGIHLKKLPIKKIAESGQKIFIDLVDQILNLKKQNKDSDTKNLESKIDQLVYKLYNLSTEEIKIVDLSDKN